VPSHVQLQHLLPKVHQNHTILCHIWHPAMIASISGPRFEKKIYSEFTSAKFHQRPLYTRYIAQYKNENSKEENEEYFNQKAQPHNYQTPQLVLFLKLPS